MTKEQFLSGTPFYVGRKKYAGANTFSYDAQNNYMLKQSRSSIDERIVLNEYECNVDRVGRVSFTGFTYVMKKKVVV
jgi:hypothetical protein